MRDDDRKKALLSIDVVLEKHYLACNEAAAVAAIDMRAKGEGR